MSEDKPIPESPVAAILEADAPEPYSKELLASVAISGAYLLGAWWAAPYAQALRLWGGLTGLALFSLLAFGLTVVTVFSVIAWPLRRLAGDIPLVGKHLYQWNDGHEPEGLLACCLCTGVWVGSILAVLGLGAWQVQDVIDVVAQGLLGTGAVWTLYAATKKLGAYSE